MLQTQDDIDEIEDGLKVDCDRIKRIEEVKAILEKLKGCEESSKNDKLRLAMVLGLIEDDIEL